jgi:hypothetical protein
VTKPHQEHATGAREQHHHQEHRLQSMGQGIQGVCHVHEARPHFFCAVLRAAWAQLVTTNDAQKHSNTNKYTGFMSDARALMRLERDMLYTRTFF